MNGSNGKEHLKDADFVNGEPLHALFSHVRQAAAEADNIFCDVANFTFGNRHQDILWGRD